MTDQEDAEFLDVGVIPCPFGKDDSPETDSISRSISHQIRSAENLRSSDSLLVRRRNLRESEPGKVNPELWPKADPDKLEKPDRDHFDRRCSAVSAFFKGLCMSQIQKQYGFSRWEVRRLCSRCLEIHPDGRIWGFRALIPGKRILAYVRKAIAKQVAMRERGDAGMLTLLLEKYPTIRNAVYKHYLRKRSGANEAHVPILSSHRVFITACRAAGVKPNEYPFTTKWFGKRALADHLKRLYSSELYAAVRAAYGLDAAARLGTGTGRLRHPAALQPYQRVQFDGHRVHGIFILNVPHPDGGFVEMLAERPWLLLIQDVVSRAILGWYIVPYNRYNAGDVLTAFNRAVVPWERKQFTIKSLAYHKLAGMPSGVFPKLQWAVFGEVLYDNAKAHLSEWVTEKLTQTLGCAINAGAVKVPERRAIIERLFHLLNERYLDRMLNTTGSNSSDHLRDGAEEAARRYRISLAHLEELLEVLIANYNSTPHGSLSYRSPLEQIDFFVNEEAMIIRNLEPEKRALVFLLTMQVTRHVVGDPSKGRRPYINFLGERYTNDVLARSPHLIGTELRLVIDTNDLRAILAFLPDGAELGVLRAAGRWAHTPHSLATRKLSNSRAFLRVQYDSAPENPDAVLALIADLTQTAKDDRRTASQLAAVRKEAGLPDDYHPGVLANHGSELPPTEAEVRPIQSPKRSIVF